MFNVGFWDFPGGLILLLVILIVLVLYAIIRIEAMLSSQRYDREVKDIADEVRRQEKNSESEDKD